MNKNNFVMATFEVPTQSIEDSLIDFLKHENVQFRPNVSMGDSIHILLKVSEDDMVEVDFIINSLRAFGCTLMGFSPSHSTYEIDVVVPMMAERYNSNPLFNLVWLA